MNPKGGVGVETERSGAEEPVRRAMPREREQEPRCWTFQSQTATQMDLSGAAFDMAMRVRELLPRYPGKWETVGYSIQDLFRRLLYFSDHGAFN